MTTNSNNCRENKIKRKKFCKKSDDEHMIFKHYKVYYIF